ncbi:MAG: GNAT family N-acetyltransferase [Hyphomicrobiaceae bacterium]
MLDISSAVRRETAVGASSHGGTPTVAGRQAARGHREAAPAVPGLALEIIHTRAAFDALEADWSALFERAGNSTQLFQTFDWNWHWCNHFLGSPRDTKQSLCLVVGRRDDRLVMVWPLIRQRQLGLTIVTWMGDPVSQYGDVLVEDASDRDALLHAGWRHVTSALGADVVALRKVRADAAVASVIAASKAETTEELEAPYLDLTGQTDLSRYEARWSTRLRRNRRRQQRRLADLGEISFRTPEPGEIAGSLALQAVTLKREWLAERGHISRAFADPRTDAFFAAVASSPTRSAGTQVQALMCGDSVAALNVGVVVKQRLALHIISYASAFEKTAPGSFGLEKLVQKAIDDGLTTVDLLAPRAEYKMEWADGTVGVRDHALALTLAGRAYMALAVKGRTRLKRVIERMPAGVRQIAARAQRLRPGRSTTA